LRDEPTAGTPSAAPRERFTAEIGRAVAESRCFTIHLAEIPEMPEEAPAANEL